MYSVLIVDDELIIRNSCLALFNRMNNPLIGEIRCCANSEEAVAMCRNWKPDIVITDIVMGAQNGIELIGELRSFLTDAEYLIISGYDDFEYARAAFKEGAADYLLKPILYPQFRKAIDNLCAHLGQGKMLRLNDSLQQFVENMAKSADRIDPRQYFPEQITAGIVSIALIAFPTYDKAGIEQELSSAAFGELFIHAAHYQKGNIIYLMFSDSADANAALESMMDAASPALAPAVVFTTTIIENMAQDYGRLQRRLAQRLRNGYRRIFSAAPSAETQPLPAETVQRLVSIIDGCRPDTLTETCRALDALFEETECECLCDLYQILSDVIRARCIRHNQRFSLQPLPEFVSFLTQDDMLRSIHSAVERYARQSTSEYTSLGVQIQQYIEENYARKLTLSEVAERFGISYAHLSHIISKAMSMSFTECVTASKMRHAKEMLYQPTMTIQEIAVRCGYDNQFTFTRTFKKYYGISPSGYRRSLENSVIE